MYQNFMKHFLPLGVLAVATIAFGASVPLQTETPAPDYSNSGTQKVEASQSFDGEGTESSPYLIKSKDDLIKLSELTCAEAYADLPQYGGSANSFENKYFKMTNDIDLEYSTDFKGISTTANKDLIGKLAFQGVFDGGGHQIKRMKIGVVNWIIKPEDNNGIGALNPSNKVKASCFIGTLGNNGVVKNLTIAADCTIEGTTYMGGIVGEAKSGSTIDNCRNYADVIAYDQVGGGIVGYLNGGVVKNCYNEGNITTGAFYAGGIAGMSAGSIQYCANAGDIKVKKLTTGGTLWLAGGITGKQDSQPITNCLNTGNISADRQVGGIAGTSTQSINSCMNYGIVSGAEETEVGIVCGKTDLLFGKNLNNTYYDSQIQTLPAVQTGNSTGATGKETADLTAGTSISGLDADKWQFNANSYPVLSQFANEPKLAKARQIVATMASGDNADAVSSDVTLSVADGLVWSLNDGAIFSIEGNILKAPAEKSETPDILTATFGNVTKEIKIMKNEASEIGPFSGRGTEESPYLIKTKEDLIKMSQMTCAETNDGLSGKTTFKDIYFKQTNDIDLEYDEEFIGISVSSQLSLSNAVLFEGTYDGDGHYIRRMKMGDVDWVERPEDSESGLGTVNTETSRNYFNRSFIGRLAGTVKNLKIASDCKIEGYSMLGGIVATMNSGALVENCYNYADIMGWSTVIGGIAGDVSPDAVIKNCYNEGNITTAIMMAGGIAGRTAGKIENCANAGDVKALGLTVAVNENANYELLQDVGGIAGNATPTTTTAQINNCLNSGTIEGYQDAGGICGSDAKASGCLNFGTVYGIDFNSCGTIFGTSSGKELSTLYCDSQTSAVGAVADGNYLTGVNPMSTVSLVSGEALSGLDASLWKFDANAYPVLKQFANEPKLSDARRIIVYFSNDETAKNVTSEVKVKPVTGFTVELKNGNKFSINGNSIFPPTGLQAKTVVDEILVKTGKLVKTIYVLKQSDLNLSGKGTEENPYKIRTAEDWNTLATFVAGSNDTFEGIYLSQTSSINFAGTKFQPLWTDGNTPFQGIYDGGKKMIANVNYEATTPNAGLFGHIGNNGIVSNVTVTGSITSKADGVGVIAGYTCGSIINCTNEATVSSSAIEVGGIAGCAGEGARFVDCVNKADITGRASIGGIVGYIVGNNTSINNCYNIGTILASENKAGGVSGYGVSTGTVFNNVWNAGNVSTSLDKQGNGDDAGYAIGGISGFSSAKYTNCYNLGDIKGASEVGGLVGRPVKDLTGFDHCYNAGRLTGDADVCGSIIGVDADNHDVWSSSNKVSDTYYVSDFGSYGNDKIGSAVKVSELAAMDFGRAWTSIDNYSLPVPSVFDSTDAALLYSVMVILADGDSYDHVTRSFNVSQTERLTWTSDVPEVTISDGRVLIAPYCGPVVLTAKLGNYEKSFNLTIDAKEGSIDAAGADNILIKESFYTLSGIQVAKPQTTDNQVYIVVKVYANGTTETVKFVNNGK